MESSDDDILATIGCLMAAIFKNSREKAQKKCMDEGMVIEKVKIFSCKSANKT